MSVERKKSGGSVGDFLVALVVLFVIVGSSKLVVTHFGDVVTVIVCIVILWALWMVGSVVLAAFGWGKSVLEWPVRPATAAAYRALSGRDARHADVLLMLGLFARDASGEVVRPDELVVVEGACTDRVRLKPIPGTATLWLRSSVAEELSHLWGFRYSIVSEVPGVIDIVIHHHVLPPPEDPLAFPVARNTVDALDYLVLRIGVDEDGNWVDVPVTDRGGFVVGGETGSGKSASVQGMLAGLVHSPLLQFAVIDGKGGADWQCFAPRSFSYVSTTSDVVRVRDLLRDIENERERRVARMPELRGSRSFWESGGPTLDMPLVVVVLDETQVFLDPDYLRTKEMKSIGSEISGLLKSLMAMGRSAGIFTILATQKPTADSIPTSVRDNASVRAAYRVNSRAAAVAILGDGWSESDSGVSPLNADSGVCVYRHPGGEYRRARSVFVPEAAIESVCGGFAHLTASPFEAIEARNAE